MGLVAAGVLVAVAMVAVPLWWSRADLPSSASSRSATPAAAQKAPVARASRPVREAAVPFTFLRVADKQCQSDQEHQRAMFRLQSTGAWPAPTGPHAREVRLIAVDSIEIEYASAGTTDEAEATVVSQPKRELTRKWEFARPVTPPLVVGVCVRSKTAAPPEPAFRINTWVEVEP